jgi:hypothetical protein
VASYDSQGYGGGIRPHHHMGVFNSSVKSQSQELLYDWRNTANQFVLAPSPLRLTVRIVSQLNTCGHSSYITSSLTRRWVCHLQLLLALASARKLFYVLLLRDNRIEITAFKDSSTVFVCVVLAKLVVPW